MTRRPYTLITGGAGFVGTNLADRLARDGRRVLVLDSLARARVEQNLGWLRERHRGRVSAAFADVRDRHAVRDALSGADGVFHLAAQVAVTTSLDDPVADFEVNAGGTLTLLEELRRLRTPPPLLFTSTNKVYGSLPTLELERRRKRWEPVDELLRVRGIGEAQALDFSTPYGCSKGTADQYVLDYAKTFGLPTLVFRMSCIYGPHQHGTEDQGWVAHFLLRALADEPITLYGDGGQVRDVLHVDDLVEAMLRARDAADRLAGTAFNIGGGPANAVSLLEVVELVERIGGSRPSTHLADPRPGDQRWYVSDTSRLGAALEWRPAVAAADGIGRLYAWLARPRRPRRLAAATAV